MKRSLLLAPLILAVSLSLSLDEAKARKGPGMRARGYGRTHGWRNRGLSRAPRMRGPEYRMSPTLRGPGYQKGLDYGYRPRYQQPREPLREKDAKGIVEHYLRALRNPHLKVGTVTEREHHFEVEILKEGKSLPDRVAIDKNTGWMDFIY